MAVASEKSNDNITDPVIHGHQPWKVKKSSTQIIRNENPACRVLMDADFNQTFDVYQITV